MHELYRLSACFFGWRLSSPLACCVFGLFHPVSLAYQLPVSSTFLSEQNQPPATSQQYFSLVTNQHQPSATGQPNRLFGEAMGMATVEVTTDYMSFVRAK
jgi:hypothetical protein